MTQIQEEALLLRVHRMEQELEQLKRALLQQLPALPVDSANKPSLFGCVRGGDVTEEIVAEAKRSLLRDLKDL